MRKSINKGFVAALTATVLFCAPGCGKESKPNTPTPTVSAEKPGTNTPAPTGAGEKKDPEPPAPTTAPEGGTVESNAEAVKEFLMNLPQSVTGLDRTKAEKALWDDAIVGMWFHRMNVFDASTQNLLAAYYVSGDLSTVYSVDPATEESALIYGTLEFRDYELITKDENGAETKVLLPLFAPSLEDGTTLAKGAQTELIVETPIHLKDCAIRPLSWDETTVSFDGNKMTALQTGITKIQVELSYRNVKGIYDMEVEIVEPEELITEEVTASAEGSSVYADRVSQRATLFIYEEEDVLGADICWGDSADVTHHWSYIGTRDENDSSVIHLIGTYVIENTENGGFTENIVFEDGEAILTYTDGIYYWKDFVNDAGKDCEFVSMEDGTEDNTEEEE
mgnify:CR=1 FL=1